MLSWINKCFKREHGYVIGNLEDDLAEILGVHCREILFSDQSLQKNLRHHPELNNNDYLNLLRFVGIGEFIAQEGEKFIVVKEWNGTLYHYVLKRTKSKKAIFLVSFRKTKRSDVERLRRKEKRKKIVIIKDLMP